MKTVITREGKSKRKILLKYFQNQQYNTNFLILSAVALLLAGSPIHTSASKKSKSLISKFYELAEDKDANVRAELAETAGKTGKPEALKLLEKMAMDKDSNVRAAVVEALGKTGRPEALKLLEKIIKNENKEKKKKQSSHYRSSIKDSAVKAIMEINKEATSFLAHYYRWKKQKEETNNKKRRYYGYSSINRLSEKNIYLQTIQNANNKTQAEKQAINLAKQTKEKVLRLLNTLSTDKDERIRRLIAKNAPQIKNPAKALTLLEKIMKNEYRQKKRPHYLDVEEALIKATVKIHQETTDFLADLGNKKEQQENQKKRRYYGRKSYTGFYQQIIQYAKNKGRAEEQAIRLSNQTKKKVFQLLNILAKDKNAEVRGKVAESIKEIKNPTETIKLLEKMIKAENKYSKEKYHNVTSAAVSTSVRIYGRAKNFLAYLDSQTKKQNKKRSYIYNRVIGDMGIYNQMIQISTNKKKAEKQAIHLANQTKKKVFHILNILVKDKDPYVRKQVVKKIPEIDESDAFHILEKLIKDKETDVRKEIVKTLKKINNLDPYNYYRKGNKNSEKINTTKTLHLLEKLAKDPDKGVRISAIKTMGKLNEN